MDEFKRWTQSFGFTHVEVSDGTIQIERDSKLELISSLAEEFVVLSEVGSKDSECVFAPYQWVAWIKEELEAGTAKVITEAREGGTAGIFRGSGEVRSGLIDEIVHKVPVDNLLFEAPQKDQQAWFIRHLGPEVNLGNIPPEEVIPLETLRLGLRSDTMAELLLETCRHRAYERGAANLTGRGREPRRRVRVTGRGRAGGRPSSSAPGACSPAPWRDEARCSCTCWRRSPRSCTRTSCSPTPC